MLLRNYYNVLAVVNLFSSKQAPAHTEIKDGSLAVKNTTGALYNVYNSTDCDLVDISFAALGSLVVGAGTTKETYNDYCLENKITT